MHKPPLRVLLVVLCPESMKFQKSGFEKPPTQMIPSRWVASAVFGPEA